jgi:hypothetical protein
MSSKEFSMSFDPRKKSDNAVFGIFETKNMVERAVDELKIQGFRNSDISVLMHNHAHSQDYAEANNTKAPEGAATGASTGILGGGILGWLAGAGVLAIPGIGPFLAAGPIMGAIAGAGIGGTIGGIAGGLIGLGIPQEDAELYEGYVREGGILLSVHVDNFDWSSRAREILESCGAQNISRINEQDLRSRDYIPRRSEKYPDSYSNDL